MLVALALALASGAPFTACDRPLPQGPAVPAPIVLRTGCGGFLLQRDGTVERLAPRWLAAQRGRAPRRYGDDLELGVNDAGAVIVRRGGRRVWRAARPHRGLTPAFGPRGALAFAADGQGVYVTDLRSRERLVLGGANVWPLAFGADGHLVVRAPDALLVLRPDGSLRRRVAYRPGHGVLVDPATDRVHAVAPDGTLLAIDGARVTRVTRLVGVRGWLSAAANGRFVFLERRRVRVWDRHGRVVAQARWRRGLELQAGLAVRPDGRALAIRLSDARPGAAFGAASIRVLDTVTGRVREVYRHRLGPAGCAPGGNLWWHGRSLLYDGYEQGLAVLDGRGGPPVRLGRLERALSPIGGVPVASAAWLADYAARS